DHTRTQYTPQARHGPAPNQGVKVEKSARRALCAKPYTSVVDFQWVVKPPLPASITCISLPPREGVRKPGPILCTSRYPDPTYWSTAARGHSLRSPAR